MTSASRSHMATKTCTLKRVALDTGTGTTTWPDGQIADIPCTPLMARNTGLFSAGRPQVEYMANSIQHEIYVFGKYDIVKGDLLVLDGKEYSIWDFQLWDSQEPFMVLILSDVQAVKPTEAEFIR